MFCSVWFELYKSPVSLMVSDSGRDVIDGELAFRCEHAQVISDQQSLLHNFLALSTLKDLDWSLVAEFGLDHIV